MLKTFLKFFATRYHAEAPGEIRKIVCLHLFMLSGLITGFVLLTKDLVLKYTEVCIPGDLAIIIIFGTALYILLFVKRSLAVQTFFLIPVIPYFFFISQTFAILPGQNSVPNTLWTLIPFLLFFMLFSDDRRNLTIYYGLSLATIALHVLSVGFSERIFQFRWESDTVYVNPFLTLTAFYVVSYLLSLNYQSVIKKLIEEKENTELLINQTIRKFPQALLILEIVNDEFGTPSHLLVRKTNLAFERLFRITSRELKDHRADDVLPKIFRNSFDWNQKFLKSKGGRFEFYLDRLDKYFEVVSFFVTDDQIAGIFSDATPKQRKIIELEENKLRYQVLLEAIPDLFFIIDKDGVYVDFVFKASDALKIKPDDIIGNSIFEVGFSEKMSAKIYQCIQSCIATDTIETIEYALELEGSSAMFEMRIVRLNDHSVISLARDISKRKLAEIRLEEAKVKAEEADRLKTAFLANISHEIRTPMNAIIGFSKMVGSNDFDDEEKSKFIEIIISNGKILLTLINDMISLSKIESNTLVVKKMPFKLNDMMVGLYKEFGYDLENQKNIKLKINCDNPNPKFTIITDQVLLMAILQKLIDNAIKFTEEGEVEFGYRMADNNHLVFFVRDTGIGIAEQDKEKIFERFHQLDNRTIRAYEGTGLGLSLSQHYVRLIGGKMEVQSKPGKGSLFSFTIPYAREESPLKVVR